MASFPFAFWRLDPNFGPTGLGFNYGYQFDGVDENISITGSLNLNTNDSFSVSYWFKRPISTSFTQDIINETDTTNGYAGLSIGGYSAYPKILIQAQDGTRVFLRGGLRVGNFANEWNHIVWIKGTGQDSSDLSLYVNGVLQSTTGSPLFYNNLSSNTSIGDNEITIGGNSSVTRFQGRVDDVQFYNFELNATQVSDIYNSGYVTAPTLGPIHHWKMGEDDTWNGTNYDVVDSVGSLNGTSLNMEESDRKLGVAYSMAFDGVDEYINFGNILNTEYNEPVSWSFWFRRGATAGGDIIQKATSSNDYRGFNIGMSGSKPRWRLISSASTTNFIRKIGNTDINQGVWNFWVCTYDGSGNLNGLKIYINGVEETYSTSQGVLNNTIINNENLEFSRSTTFGALTPINGDLMYVAQYTSEISASDVTSLYNSGVPVDPLDVGLSPSFFAPLGSENDSFSTNWTIVDEINGNNGTSVNMEESDKTSETP